MRTAARNRLVAPLVGWATATVLLAATAGRAAVMLGWGPVVVGACAVAALVAGLGVPMYTARRAGGRGHQR